MEVVVVPVIELNVDFAEFGPLLPDGAAFALNVIISHNSTESQDAHNFSLFLMYPAEYALPANSTVTFHFSNGTTETQGHGCQD